jgi:L-lactate dehydrogenase complex protein LldG
MSARDRILGRLRAASPLAAGMTDLERRIDAHFDARRDDPPAAADVLARRMQAALQAVRAQAWCARAGEWPAQLAQRLSEAGVSRILVDAVSAEGRALRAALPAGVEALAFERPLEAWKAELFGTVDAGFTVARSGIAATGTLVLAPDATTPRTVSLVPPLHIALVYAHTLHADLHQALHAERWQDGMPANLVLATGPSKTSDIQQTLAFGAHGPRWTWVVIVTDAKETV